MRVTILTCVGVLAASATSAMGAYTVNQTFAPAPTYAGHSVTFDEPGVPTNVAMDPFTFYQGSDGVTFTSGNGFLVASDWDATDGIDGGEGMGNQLRGGFSVRMLFDHDVSEISWQGWAAGSPGPPFGGINVLIFNDDVQVGSYQGLAPFGGAGDEWFNVIANGGDVFDEIRFFNPAFNSFASYVDNISWNEANVPAPGVLALLGAAGLFGSRRRRTGG